MARARADVLDLSEGGTFRRLETRVLMTQGELFHAPDEASEVAYTAPGAALHA